MLVQNNKLLLYSTTQKHILITNFTSISIFKILRSVRKLSRSHIEKQKMYKL